MLFIFIEDSDGGGVDFIDFTGHSRLSVFDQSRVASQIEQFIAGGSLRDSLRGHAQQVVKRLAMTQGAVDEDAVFYGIYFQSHGQWLYSARADSTTGDTYLESVLE